MTAAGIDVGKAALDLAVDGEAGVQRFANTTAGISKLIRRLGKLAHARVVVEATGGYESVWRCSSARIDNGERSACNRLV